MESKFLDYKRLRRLLAYVRRHRLLVSLSIATMLGFNGLSVLQPYLVKVGIDKYVSRGDVPGLQGLVLILGLVLVAGLLCQFFFNVTIQYLGQRLLFDLRMDLFGKVLALSSDYFDKTAVGKTLTNVTNDVEAIREFVSEGIITVIGDLLRVAFIVVAMFLLSPTLALLTFITIPLFVMATAMFRRSIRTGYRGVRKANAEINTSLNETITGIREIKLFNIQDRSAAAFAVYNRNYLDAYLKTVFSYALYFPVLEVVSNLSMIIILIYGHYAAGISLDVGVIFAFFSYVNMFFRPLRQLAEKFNMFQSAMAAAERAFRLLDTPVTITSTPEPETLPARLKGQITFRHVGFAYTEEAPVFDDLSFSIRPGERVALVGHTGSGKTTIISLLNRLYDIRRGAILLDGVDIRRLNIRDLRKRIATIPQDVFLFTGTIAENIALFDPNITPDRIEEAARQALFHHFVQRMPQGYEQNVLEEGKLLSAGQRQLLSFARALVRDPQIVILDEATSNIDSETESLIESAINNLLCNRTAIIIAHRLSTIRSADRILVLQKGKLIEEGTHEELLAAGGHYSELYRMQAFLSN